MFFHMSWPSSGTFAAAEAAEWVQREAVVAAHALEARRLKAQRRAAAEGERRAQVANPKPYIITISIYPTPRSSRGGAAGAGISDP